jgi:FixJ family two-component response regulator
VRVLYQGTMDAAPLRRQKRRGARPSLLHALATMIPRRNRIAVVDDDDGVRRALARLLRADGFESVLFPSAEALLRCDDPEAFQCAILDICLDGMSGLTLARRLASAAPRMEIIFITAADTAAHREQAARVGCLAYFGKPFDGDEMLQAIRRATTDGG